MQNRNLRNIRVPKKQRGLTLIELAVGLAIVLAITALVVGVYTTTSRSQRTNDVQTQLTQISSQVRSLAPAGNFAGITTKVLADSQKIPDSWIGGTAAAPTITTPFGGTIAVAEADLAPGTDNAFTITVNDLPVAACNDIITNSLANFVIINAGATDVKTVADPDAAPADIATACAATGDTVDVIFTAV